MIAWKLNMQPNGMGWLSDCGNYGIRECMYINGQSGEFWCYYKPAVGYKFMHIPDGVKSSFLDAAAFCQQKKDAQSAK